MNDLHLQLLKINDIQSSAYRLLISDFQTLGVKKEHQTNIKTNSNINQTDQKIQNSQQAISESINNNNNPKQPQNTQTNTQKTTELNTSNRDGQRNDSQKSSQKQLGRRIGRNNKNMKFKQELIEGVKSKINSLSSKDSNEKNISMTTTSAPVNLSLTSLMTFADKYHKVILHDVNIECIENESDSDSEDSSEEQDLNETYMLHSPPGGHRPTMDIVSRSQLLGKDSDIDSYNSHGMDQDDIGPMSQSELLLSLMDGRYSIANIKVGKIQFIRKQPNNNDSNKDDNNDKNC